MKQSEATRLSYTEWKSRCLTKVSLAELSSEYGLFLAEIVAAVVVVAVVMILIVNATQHECQRGELRATNLNDQYKEMKEGLSLALLDGHQQKLWHKARKKEQKLEAKVVKAKAKPGDSTSSDRPHVQVFDSKGNTDAHEVSALREEVAAVLTIVKSRDQVTVCLESPDGVVRDYGLAALQLQCLRDKQIPPTITVDKVAASGGYMMACVADKIVPAPFTIADLTGVVVRIPNSNRSLKGKDTDIELHTTGQHKRTLALLGGNTEEGRQKFREDPNETHHLFKDFMHRMRPVSDIEQVITDEHWFGQQVLADGLVNEINTSDEVAFGLMEGRKVLNVCYLQRKRLADCLTGSVMENVNRLSMRWRQRGQKPPI